MKLLDDGRVSPESSTCQSKIRPIHPRNRSRSGSSRACSTSNVRFPRTLSVQGSDHRPCSPLITASICSIDIPSAPLLLFRHRSLPGLHRVLASSLRRQISSISMSASHLSPGRSQHLRDVRPERPEHCRNTFLTRAPWACRRGAYRTFCRTLSGLYVRWGVSEKMAADRSSVRLRAKANGAVAAPAPTCAQVMRTTGTLRQDRRLVGFGHGLAVGS